jgi:hypothetical protein
MSDLMVFVLRRTVHLGESWMPVICIGRATPKAAVSPSATVM